MYLLFVDESGTHGSAEAFILGGMAIHEQDAARLQQQLETLVAKHLGRRGEALDHFELHAGEMRNAKKPSSTTRHGRPSVWAEVPRLQRLDLLEAAYRLIADFRPADARQPHYLFGVALDKRFMQHDAQVNREQYAYEILLNKFDVMLKHQRVKRGLHNRGLVIHDRRVIAERDIQAWTAEWRVAAGRVGQLKNLADVPLFADSRASRLLQVADLVAYALSRNYMNPSDPRYLELIWDRFHTDNGVQHGCAHYTPSFGQRSCSCRPCTDRIAVVGSSPATGRRTRRGGRRHRSGRRSPAPDTGSGSNKARKNGQPPNPSD